MSGKVIPGFRYDKATNRYFALRPGETIVEPNDGIMKKNVEEVKEEKVSISKILNDMQLGTIRVPLFRRQSSICMIQHNSNVKKQEVEQYTGTSDNRNIWLSPLDNSPFMLQWSNHSCKLMINYYDTVENRLATTVVDQCPTAQSGSLINAVSWGNQVDTEHCHHIFMMSLSGSANNGGRFLMYATKTEKETDDLGVRLCIETKEVSSLVAYKKDIFTSCWQSQSNNISLGVTRGCMLLDGATCRVKSRYSLFADALQQQISTEGIIFNGLRGGKIEQIDIRASGRVKSFTLGLNYRRKGFYQSVNPLQMKLFRDENYLLSSYSNGQILLWDRRRDDVLFSFGNSLKRFCVNNEEDIVYTMNDENELRSWNLWNQNLIDSSTMPICVSPKSLCYNDTWPLFHHRKQRFPSGEPVEKIPTLCLLSSNDDIFTHSLFSSVK